MEDINSESEGFFSSEDWMTKIVVLLLAVVMVGAILIPIIGSLTNPTVNVLATNEGDFTFSEVGSETHTISITNDNGSPIISSDGKTINTDNISYPFVFVYGEMGMALLIQSPSGLGIRLIDYHNTSVPGMGLISDGQTVTFTFDKDTITQVSTPIPISPMMYCSANGDYVLTTSPVVESSSDICMAKIYSSNLFAILGYGTAENMSVMAIPMFNSFPATIVTGCEYVLNTTESDNGLITISDATVTIHTGNSYDGTVVTVSEFIAPSKIYSDPIPSIIDSASTKAILTAIPILMLIGVVLFVTATFIYRKEDIEQ